MPRALAETRDLELRGRQPAARCQPAAAKQLEFRVLSARRGAQGRQGESMNSGHDAAQRQHGVKLMHRDHCCGADERRAGAARPFRSHASCKDFEFQNVLAFL
jgi:hypothetical protein